MRGKIAFRFLLLLAWMGLLYWSSATPDLRAVPLLQRWGLLSRLLEPVAVHLLELLLRKSAHVVAYAVLGVLAYRVFETSRSRRSSLLAALAMAVLYAIGDEWHQSLVPTREAHLRDVLFDTAGALAGLWVTTRAGRRTRS